MQPIPATRPAPLSVLGTALAALAALLATSPASADTAPTRLVCNQAGAQVFQVQFGGPRYADSFSVHSFDGNLIKKLLTAGELGFTFGSSSIRGSLSVGRCTATPAGRDVILSCSATSAAGRDWVFGTYQFQHGRKIGATDFYEDITVERGLSIDSMRLTVKKQRAYDPVLRRDYTAAHLTLELDGQSPFASFSMKDERTLGELVSEDRLTPWETCAFVK